MASQELLKWDHFWGGVTDSCRREAMALRPDSRTHTNVPNEGKGASWNATDGACTCVLCSPHFSAQRSEFRTVRVPTINNSTSLKAWLWGLNKVPGTGEALNWFSCDHCCSSDCYNYYYCCCNRMLTLTFLLRHQERIEAKHQSQAPKCWIYKGDESWLVSLLQKPQPEQGNTRSESRQGGFREDLLCRELLLPDG